MKNVIASLRKGISLLLVLFALSAAAAASPGQVLIKVGLGQKLEILLQQVEGPTEVQLLGAAGEVLYQEKVLSNRYAKAFNLSAMEQGDYIVVVTLKGREVRQPFRLTGSDLSLDPSRRVDVLLPQIRLQEEAVDLSMANRQISDVRVSIVNADGELVYEDLLSNVTVVQRRYNLSKLPKGAYTFVVRTPERILYQDFAR